MKNNLRLFGLASLCGLSLSSCVVYDPIGGPVAGGYPVAPAATYYSSAPAVSSVGYYDDGYLYNPGYSSYNSFGSTYGSPFYRPVGTSFTYISGSRHHDHCDTPRYYGGSSHHRGSSGWGPSSAGFSGSDGGSRSGSSSLMRSSSSSRSSGSSMRSSGSSSHSRPVMHSSGAGFGSSGSVHSARPAPAPRSSAPRSSAPRASGGGRSSGMGSFQAGSSRSGHSIPKISSLSAYKKGR